jgi:deoxyribose-phosphate aldolase
VPDPLAARIDHTLLRPEATRSQIVALCEQANEHGFRAVCVNPVWVVLAAETVRPPVRVCSVAGFPLGASASSIKVAEVAAAVASGAHEVDVVLQLGWLLEAVPADGERPVDDRALAAVRDEIRRTRDALLDTRASVPPERRALKVILEMPLLDARQQRVAAGVAIEGGADFLKTGTGTAGPATVDDVALLAGLVRGHARVKAAGGIRDRDTALALVEAGADCLGCSASLDLLPGG